MKALLDNTIEFELVELGVGSWSRERVDRGAAGVDGIVSVDLGLRVRQIVVKGRLRGVSVKSLGEKVDLVCSLMDSKVHELTVCDGREFGDLQVESFEVTKEDSSGIGPYCEFEMGLRQLRSL